MRAQPAHVPARGGRGVACLVERLTAHSSDADRIELGIDGTDVRLSADVALPTPQRVTESSESGAHWEREESFEGVGYYQDEDGDDAADREEHCRPARHDVGGEQWDAEGETAD